MLNLFPNTPMFPIFLPESAFFSAIEAPGARLDKECSDGFDCGMTWMGDTVKWLDKMGKFVYNQGVMILGGRLIPVLPYL